MPGLLAKLLAAFLVFSLIWLAAGGWRKAKAWFEGSEKVNINLAYALAALVTILVGLIVMLIAASD